MFLKQENPEMDDFKKKTLVLKEKYVCRKISIF